MIKCMTQGRFVPVLDFAEQSRVRLCTLESRYMRGVAVFLSVAIGFLRVPTARPGTSRPQLS